MAEPRSQHASMSRITLTEQARQLLAEASQQDAQQPCVAVELTVLYEVMGLVSRRFTVLGTNGIPGESGSNVTLRAGSLTAAAHLGKALRATELAWLAARPIMPRRTTSALADLREEAWQPS